MYFSTIWVVLVCCLYVASTFYALIVLRYITVLLLNSNAISGTLNPRYEVKDPCSVCSNNSCKRHKLFPNSTKVKIPKDFDQALEQVIAFFF